MSDDSGTSTGTSDGSKTGLGPQKPGATGAPALGPGGSTTGTSEGPKTGLGPEKSAETPGCGDPGKP